MGDDSKARLVTSVNRGREQMARVSLVESGDSFECNVSHVLSLRCAGLVAVHNELETDNKFPWRAVYHTIVRSTDEIQPTVVAFEQKEQLFGTSILISFFFFFVDGILFFC